MSAPSTLDALTLAIAVDLLRHFPSVTVAAWGARVSLDPGGGCVLEPFEDSGPPEAAATTPGVGVDEPLLVAIRSSIERVGQEATVRSLAVALNALAPQQAQAAEDPPDEQEQQDGAA